MKDRAHIVPVLRVSVAAGQRFTDSRGAVPAEGKWYESSRETAATFAAAVRGSPTQGLLLRVRNGQKTHPLLDCLFWDQTEATLPTTPLA